MERFRTRGRHPPSVAGGCRALPCVSSSGCRRWIRVWPDDLARVERGVGGCPPADGHQCGTTGISWKAHGADSALVRADPWRLHRDRDESAGCLGLLQQSRRHDLRRGTRVVSAHRVRPARNVDPFSDTSVIPVSMPQHITAIARLTNTHLAVAAAVLGWTVVTAPARTDRDRDELVGPVKSVAVR